MTSLWCSYPVEAFLHFHEELTAARRRVEEFPFIHHESSDGTSEPGEERVRRVRAPLIASLRSQELEAGRRGGEAGSLRYRIAQFAMVALADEVFLTLDWDGRTRWGDSLLETEFFGSRLAGEEFYVRCDELVRRSAGDERNLGLVYLLALNLGFEGMVRGADDRSAITSHRTRLQSFAFPHGFPLSESRSQLMAQPYGHVLSGANRAALPNPRRWMTVFAVVILVYLGGSFLIWRSESAPLWDAAAIVDQIGEGVGQR
jgi:type VI secretion system protein ImpK